MIIVIAVFRKPPANPIRYLPPEMQYEEIRKSWVFSTWDQVNGFTYSLKNSDEKPHTVSSTLVNSLEIMS